MRNISTDQPIVLIIDNLHWADGASLDLLEFISPDLSGIPVLIVGTYRDVEVSRRHPLSKVLANLNRDRSFQRISLGGLNEAEVDRLVTEGVGRSLSVEAMRSLHDRADGNPFFVREFIRLASTENKSSSWASESGSEWWIQIPEGVREVIGHRLDSLSDDCNRVLSLAAVVGTGFGLEVLNRLVDDLDELPILELLDEAITAGIVELVADAPGDYLFTHALIGQTLVDELQTSSRIGMHAHLAQVLEDLYGENAEQYAAELAHHFSEAETVLGREKSIHYSVVAGERALTASNYRDAERNFRQAANSSRELPVDEIVARGFRGLGIVLTSSEIPVDRQLGWDFLVRAFNYYVEVEDVTSAIGIANTPVAFHRLRGTADLVAKAVKLVDPDSLQAGHLLTRHSIAVRDEFGDFTEDLRLLEAARVIASSHDDKLLEARVHLSLGQHFNAAGDRAATIEHCQKAEELAREVQDPSTEVRAILFGGRAKVSTFDSAGAEDLFRRHWELAQKLRYPTTIGLNRESVFNISRDKGRWVTATEIASSERSRTRDQTLYLQRELTLDYFRSDIPDDDERLHAFVAGGASVPHDVLVLATVSWMAARSTKLIDLIPEFAGMASELNVEEIMIKKVAECVRVFATEDEQAAAKLHAELLRFGGWWNRRGGNSLDHVLGMLANLCGKQDAAYRHLETAIDDCRGAEFKPELALCCGDYAAMLLGDNSHTDNAIAALHVSEGMDIARQLDMQPLIHRLELLAERIDETASVSGSSFPSGLSGREVEVIRLVATGMTNQQIGDQLFISRYTVNRHIANIFSKTESANRAEAATYAMRHGLLDN